MKKYFFTHPKTKELRTFETEEERDRELVEFVSFDLDENYTSDVVIGVITHEIKKQRSEYGQDICIRKIESGVDYPLGSPEEIEKLAATWVDGICLCGKNH